MSLAKKCNSISDVRQEIDRIDKELIKLLVERCDYVRQVMNFKNREDIIDEKRIEEIIKKQRGVAEQNGMDGDIAEAVWREMINQFIKMEEKIYDQREN